MLRKELKETFMQMLFVVVFAGCVTLFTLVSSLLFEFSLDFGELFLAVFQVGLMILALVTGLGLFASERRQGGVEYLLTFPMSRYGLMGTKVLARLTGLVSLGVVYLALFAWLGGGEFLEIPALPPGMLIYAALSLFIIGVTLSLSHENFVLLALLGLFLAFAHFFMVFGLIYMTNVKVLKRYFQYSPGMSIFVGLVTVLIPLVISFLVAYKKFDIRAPRGFNRVFGKILAPLMIAGLAISMVFSFFSSEEEYRHYYLTMDHQVVVETISGIEMYGKGSVHKYKDESFSYVRIEEGDYLYTLSHNKVTGWRVVRINKKNYRKEVLYDLGGRLFYSRALSLFRGKLAFFKSNNKEHWKWGPALVQLNLETREVKEIDMEGKLPDRYPEPMIFGAGIIDGKQFWLIRSARNKQNELLRFWEDGKIEPLGYSWKRPLYANNLLITTDKEGMIFSELTAEGTREVKKITQGRKIGLFTTWRFDMDNENMKEIFARYQSDLKSKDIFRIDLENLTVSSMGKLGGHVWNSFPGFSVWTKREHDEKSGNFYLEEIGLLKDGKLDILKKFSLADRADIRGVSRAGVILEEKGKIRVYTLPGFQELQFKKLN